MESEPVELLVDKTVGFLLKYKFLESHMLNGTECIKCHEYFGETVRLVRDNKYFKDEYMALRNKANKYLMEQNPPSEIVKQLRDEQKIIPLILMHLNRQGIPLEEITNTDLSYMTLSLVVYINHLQPQSL